jgi:hypothetical protein
MLKTTALCLACLASVSLTPVAASAATPEPSDLMLVNYGHCDEQPSMPHCRDYRVPSQTGATSYEGYQSPRQAHQAPRLPAYRG